MRRALVSLDDRHVRNAHRELHTPRTVMCGSDTDQIELSDSGTAEMGPAEIEFGINKVKVGHIDETTCNTVAPRWRELLASKS